MMNRYEPTLYIINPMFNYIVINVFTLVIIITLFLASTFSESFLF